MKSKLFLLRLCAALFLTLAASHAAEFFSTNAVWRFRPGQSEASSPDITAWRRLDFDDSSFSNAPAPFWYGDVRTGGTQITNMINSYSSIFLRKTFVVTNVAEIALLRLSALVDDGFIAWINTNEVRRVNMPAGEPVYTNFFATGATEPVPFLTYDLPPPGAYLVPGTNVLAIQVFNTTLASTDLGFDAALSSVLVDTNPPTLANFSPSQGTVTNLTQITVTFSETVTGVTPDDLIVNGVAATGVSGAGATYTFTFPPPPYGGVDVNFATNSGIADLAAPPNPFDPAGPGTSWLYTFVDVVPPQVAAQFPTPGATVRSLGQVEITFSEGVAGVEAADLRVNNVACTNVLSQPGFKYLFQFAEPAPGSVMVAWDGAHGITDLAAMPNPFDGGSWSYTLDPNAPIGSLVLNEILAANVSTNGLKDPVATPQDADPLPWIEIYNGGAGAIDLGGWSLSDDPDDPGQWVFPPRLISPGQYLIVFASGLNIKNPSGTNRFHTNFRLSRGGEFIGLYTPDSPRQLASGYTYPEQRNDISYGYDTQNALRYFSTPTPGAPNGSSTVIGVSEPVHFSTERGHFTAPFTLVLTTPTPGATIRYTTSGADPTPFNSLLYLGPIGISNTVLVRATAFKTNFLSSIAVTHSYLFNLPAAYRTLPVISIVTDQNNLTGPNGIIGISNVVLQGDGTYLPGPGGYHNPSRHGVAWERPTSVEFIRPEDNSGFQVDAGIRVQGSDYQRPRTTTSSKFSFRLYFRSDYGSGRLHYPLFPLSTREDFDQVVLRAGFNENNNPFIRDELTRRLSHDMGDVAAHGNMAIVLLNGVAYASSPFYNPCERVHEEHLQSYLGGGEDWDVVSPSFAQGAGEPGVVDGDRANFASLMSYVNTQNAATPAIYQEILRRLDVTNFVDYLLLNTYCAMGDWPQNNWRAGRERATNALWRFIVWDAEWAMGIYGRSVNINMFSNSGAGPDLGGLASTGDSEIAQLYSRLYASQEFRLLWADRIQKHMFNGGALIDSNITNRFGQLRTELVGVIPSMNTDILTTWVPQRRNILFGQFNQFGLMASSNAPVFNQFGGRVPRGFNLTMTAPSVGGTIYFTTNGVDPRVAFTSAIASDATAYTAPVTLNQSTLVKARTLNAGNWSALTETTFETALLGVPLRITEIHYNPADSPAYEFIELQNVGAAPIDLGGMTFSGITYTFSLGTILSPGSTFLLISGNDPIAFTNRYPGVTFNGVFSGSLNNGGERIAIFDTKGNLVTSLDYDDAGGWPTAADGGGSSLETIDPLGDPDDPANWRASTVPGGTPGTVSPPPSLPSVRLTEVMAENFSAVNNAGTYPDWIEVFNAGPGSVDLGGWSLTDDGAARKFVFPAGTTLIAGEYRAIWCDDTTNTSPGLHTGFVLNRGGDNVYLYDPATNLVDAISFGLQLADYTVGRVAGSWQLNTPTPNAPNTAATLGSVTNLSINEWLANPAPGLPDWIELFNRSSNQPVALRGAALATASAVHQITSLSFIAPRGYAQFFADEQVGPDHLDFKLPAAGGVIILYDQTGTESQRVTYTAQTEGVTAGRLPDGSTTITTFPGTPSPKTTNYTLSYSGPYLNEVMARNKTVYTNALGQVVDWVELFNPSGLSASLAGMRLSADTVEPRQWVFPAGASIAGNGYLVITFDGSRPASTNVTAVLNTGHSLDGDSGGVYLFNTAGQLVNSIEYGFQVDNLSIGRTGTVWRLLSVPTPGATNSAPPATLGPVTALRLNEWMANPVSGDDWFELFNLAAQPVDMGGLYLTDDPSLVGQTNFVVPPLSFIGPSRWVKWEADGNTAAGRNHAAFSLDAQGESLRLYATNFAVLDAVYFAAQAAGASEGRLPDGASGIVRFPASASPGESNYLPPDTATINEALSHTDDPLEDAIEVRNPSSVAVNLGGWYLSDSQDNFLKYRIPDNTILPAGGYLVFYQNQFGGPGGFTLDSARGDEIWLSQADASANLSGYRATARFGASLNGVSFGRHVTHLSTDFVALSGRTFGADTPASLTEFRGGMGLSNASPKIGPIVVSEIMYHPPLGTNVNADPDEEFIELHNTGAGLEPLHDPARTTNTWRLANAVSYSFPAGLSLPSGGYLLVVSFDPVTDPARLAAFRSHYGLSMSVPIFGPYSGKLDNDGEQVELLRPDSPEPDGFVPQVLVEKINYTDTAPWPAGGTDAGGLSMQRRSAAAYANEPENWLASAPTPGAANGAGIVPPPVVTSSPVGGTVLVGAPVGLSVTATGAGTLRYQWRLNRANLFGATNATFVINSALLEDDGEYDVFVSNAGGSSFSQPATLRVDAPPVILVPPQNAIVRGGTNVLFSVVAAGSTPLVYEWRFNGVPVPGATGPSLLITNVQPAQNGDYTVLVTNRVSTASVTVSLTVLLAPVSLQPHRAMTATQGPTTNLTVFQWDTVIFTIGANGSPLPLSYRWRRNPGGVTITNIITTSTNASLILSNVHPTSSGSYTVAITNLAGASSPALSAAVQLTVIADNDHDLIPDDWERLYAFNTNSLADASADPDGDTMSNYAEYLAGTNPTNGLSYLKIDSTTLVPGPTNTLVLTLSAVSNHTYSIICRDDVATGVWVRLADVDARPTNRVVSITNSAPTDVTNRFYRVQTPRLP